MEKIHNAIKIIRKESIYEFYTRIIKNHKEYDKISVSKMMDEVCKFYDNYENIIDICTLKELKYLEKILECDKNLDDDKYFWTRQTLWSKFLVITLNENPLPEEYAGVIQEAINKVNWQEKEKQTYLNEILIGFCKIQAKVSLEDLISYAVSVTKFSENEIINHIQKDQVFSYYVMIKSKKIKNKPKQYAIYQAYSCLDADIDKQRKKVTIENICNPSPNLCQTLLYNDFDINNPKIKKALKEIDKLPYFSSINVKHSMRRYTVMNLDREDFKNFLIKNEWYPENNKKEFFKILNDAMDEMPSAALYGFSRNQIKESDIYTKIN